MMFFGIGEAVCVVIDISDDDAPEDFRGNCGIGLYGIDADAVTRSCGKNRVANAEPGIEFIARLEAVAFADDGRPCEGVSALRLGGLQLGYDDSIGRIGLEGICACNSLGRIVPTVFIGVIAWKKSGRV